MMCYAFQNWGYGNPFVTGYFDNPPQSTLSTIYTQPSFWNNIGNENIEVSEQLFDEQDKIDAVDARLVANEKLLNTTKNQRELAFQHLKTACSVQKSTNGQGRRQMVNNVNGVPIFFETFPMVNRMSLSQLYGILTSSKYAHQIFLENGGNDEILNEIPAITERISRLEKEIMRLRNEKILLEKNVKNITVRRNSIRTHIKDAAKIDHMLLRPDTCKNKGSANIFLIGGGDKYFQKYLKYKAKYENLKQMHKM